MKQWVVHGSEGSQSLQLEEVPIPEPGDYEILVKFHAASLNYRDIMIVNVRNHASSHEYVLLIIWNNQGDYYFPIKPGVVPGYVALAFHSPPHPRLTTKPSSDAAGEIIKSGPKVTRLKPGQRVSPIFHLTNLYGSVRPGDLAYQLGSAHDGVFREYAVFNEQACVQIPHNLDYCEASALPCAAVTAWNALYGGPRQLRPGETVLTQGTGGVSVFALQFAKAGGARIIATTSSPDKAEKLRVCGADATINYKEDGDWGTTAKSHSIGGGGVDVVVEIGGAVTMAQSVLAAKIDGQIAVVGARGGEGKNAAPGGPITATVRPIMVGSRQDFELMNSAIEINGLKPAVDAKRFGFRDLQKAYDYLQTGQHFGKVIIDFD